MSPFRYDLRIDRHDRCTEMEPLTTQPTRATCPNCGSAALTPIPFSCAQCSFAVVRSLPRWRDRPLAWNWRLLMLAWPLLPLINSLPFYRRGDWDEIAAKALALSTLAALINTPTLLIAAAVRPPRFIALEPINLASRRRRLTTTVTIGLGLLIPLLLFGSCMYVVSVITQNIRANMPHEPNQSASPLQPTAPHQ